MRKTMCAGLLAVVVGGGAGCFGSFAAVQRVHALNGSITESRFVHTIVMYALVAFPVYTLAVYADVLVFNVIEFWTENNPIAASVDRPEDTRVATADGAVTVTRDGHALTLVPTADGRMRVEVDGRVKGYAVPTADGGLALHAVDGTLLHAFSGAQLGALHAALSSPTPAP